eukprot:CAMPEP_0176011884 /NCGR_PEP_ID=MMETSP0120_2-20121206/5511_1 /TAXON_ID=160619 /ORGANISM="Kryptoperidinium foliaceum, Strain CCMP 1326" /LENGTH=74 /DNA_ID=CAMNT_0017344755 /DNA_START=28 /DNA_END=249 /DNA_ORIENTATION=+
MASPLQSACPATVVNLAGSASRVASPSPHIEMHPMASGDPSLSQLPAGSSVSVPMRTPPILGGSVSVPMPDVRT